MKIGILLGSTPGPKAGLEQIVASAKDIEVRGFASLWIAHIRGHDSIVAMALAGGATQRIEVGPAVIPIQPRHPVALAQQALSAAAATRGRFTLGIGLSHKIVIETMHGLSYARPAATMREYLAVLGPLLRGAAANHAGEIYRVNMSLEVADAPLPVPILVAALGPQMLELTGRLSDGTVLWMTGPRTIADHVVPILQPAATAAGRPSPRILAGFPIALTARVDDGRAEIGRQLAVYGQLPSYRAMLDREGVRGPAELALVGDESALRAALRRVAAAGATDFVAVPMECEPGAAARTLDFLQTCI